MIRNLNKRSVKSDTLDDIGLINNILFICYRTDK